MIVSVCDGFEKKIGYLTTDSLRNTALDNEDLFIGDIEFN